MDPKTRKKRLALGIESAFSSTTFPTVREWPFDELTDLTDAKAPIETARHTGRTGMTSAVPGPDSGSVGGKLEAVGFSGGAVGDGVTPPAADYLDDFLAGFANLDRTEDGEGGSLSGADFTVDVAGGYAAGDLIPIQVSGTGETQFAIIDSVASNVYTLDRTPVFTGTPDLAPGSKTYVDDEGNDNSDSYAGIFEQDSDQFDLHGCKLTGVSLSAAPDARVMFDATLGVDRIDVAGTETPPSFVGTPSGTPQRITTVYVDGTEVDCASVEIDFGIDAQPRASTAKDSGRSEHLHMAVNPTITIVPVYTHAHRNLKRNQTEVDVLVQFGSNLAFHAPVCQVSEAAPTDASGAQRQTLTIAVKDPKSATLPKWQLVRA